MEEVTFWLEFQINNIYKSLCLIELISKTTEQIWMKASYLNDWSIDAAVVDFYLHTLYLWFDEDSL